MSSLLEDKLHAIPKESRFVDSWTSTKLRRFEGKTIEESSIVNLNFNLNLIHYVFVKQEIPDFIETVPVVESKVKNVSLDYLNQIYSEYTEKVGRKVEGFVILDLLSGIQTKYVRLKRGKMTEHKA